MSEDKQWFCGQGIPVVQRFADAPPRGSAVFMVLFTTLMVADEGSSLVCGTASAVYAVLMTSSRASCTYS
jgi:hypothetical protein